MERDIAATTRMGSRSSTRSGPAAAFVGKVRKWEKKWVKNASERLQLHQWVPLPVNPSVIPNLKNDAASEAWKPRYVPVYGSVKRFTPSTLTSETADVGGSGAGPSGEAAGDSNKRPRVSKEEEAGPSEPAVDGSAAATRNAGDAGDAGAAANQGDGAGIMPEGSAMQVDGEVKPEAAVAGAEYAEAYAEGDGAEDLDAAAVGGCEAAGEDGACVPALDAAEDKGDEDAGADTSSGSDDAAGYA
eukprot:jgi/Mesvir1/25192/Mv12889-RA.1